MHSMSTRAAALIFALFCRLIISAPIHQSAENLNTDIKQYNNYFYPISYNNTFYITFYYFPLWAADQACRNQGMYNVQIPNDHIGDELFQSLRYNNPGRVLIAGYKNQAPVAPYQCAVFNFDSNSVEIRQGAYCNAAFKVLCASVPDYSNVANLISTTTTTTFTTPQIFVYVSSQTLTKPVTTTLPVTIATVITSTSTQTVYTSTAPINTITVRSSSVTASFTTISSIVTTSVSTIVASTVVLTNNLVNQEALVQTIPVFATLRTTSTDVRFLCIPQMNSQQTLTVTVTVTTVAKSLMSGPEKQLPTASVCAFQTNHIFGLNYFGSYPQNASLACQQYGGSLLEVRPAQLNDIQAVLDNCGMQNGALVASYNNLSARSCLAMSSIGDAEFYNEFEYYCDQPRDVLCFQSSQSSVPVASNLVVSTSTIVTTQKTTSTATFVAGTVTRTNTSFLSTVVTFQVQPLTVSVISTPQMITQTIPIIVTSTGTTIVLGTSTVQTTVLSVLQTTRTTTRFTTTIFSTSYLSTVGTVQTLWNLTC